SVFPSDSFSWVGSDWESSELLISGLEAEFLLAVCSLTGVYHWNSGIKGSGAVNEKWMKEFVFFGMIIIPVYMLSALMDAFIFNSIQFWSGNNPVNASELGDDNQPTVVQVGDLTMRWARTNDGATVSYERHGIVELRATIVSSATGYRLIDDRGMTLAEAEYTADGTVTVLDQDCQVVQRWTGDQLQEIAASRGTTLGESIALLSSQ